MGFLHPQYGLVQYLRLKFQAILLRIMSRILYGPMMRRDAALIPKGVRKERVEIPSRDMGRFIAADIYYPPGYSTSTPAPVLVNWHGSGFMLPGHGSDALMCGRAAHGAGVVVVDAEYRKGPETPHPGLLHDAEDALRWVAARPGLDARRVALSGNSSGGTLALVAASALRRRLAHLLDVRAVVATYPLTDAAAAVEAKTVPHPVKPLPGFFLRAVNECYMPDETRRSDPTVSPAYADPADFPPITAIVACDGDVFFPEEVRFAEKLRNKGGPEKVVLHVLKGVGHGFEKGANEGTLEWNSREEVYDLTVDLLKEAFGL